MTTQKDGIGRRLLLAAGTASLASRRVMAADPVIRIGLLTDLSGDYRDNNGLTAVACCQQAIDEFGTGHGFRVELITADHQNKPDVGLAIARRWFDNDGVDLLLDATLSSLALAVQSVVRDRNKVFIANAAATDALTAESCSPNFVHWTHDTWMLAKSTGGAVVGTGGKSWFFITADYAFGHQMQKGLTQVVTKAGGRIAGSVLYPSPGTSDFSSLLLQASSSGASVLALCNGGAESINSVKQAHEFGISRQMKVAATLSFLTDVKSIGLDDAQGLLLTESFYWDLNERTRAFTKRLLQRKVATYPNMNHAGAYAATLHYLKAVAAMGPEAAKKDGRATVARMKSIPGDDDAFGQGQIREDGRNLVDAHLFRVKAPAESRNAWDLYALVATTPKEDAFRPLGEGHCPFIKA